MSDICYNCAGPSSTSVKVGHIEWDLCKPCSQIAIPSLIAEDANNTLMAVNTFGPYGIISDWANKTVFEIPKQQALYEKPHLVVLSENGCVILQPNGHLIVDADVDGKKTRVHLENVARNNCDLRGTNTLLDIDKFDQMTQTLTNAAQWKDGAQYLKDVEDSFTVIGSFVQN